VRPGRFVLPLATIGLLALTGASGRADTQQTVDSQIPGLLVGVGPGQRSLTVAWDNALAQGCGAPTVTPSVVETGDSVSVVLTAQETALPPEDSCGGVGLMGTVTVPLTAPLGGRALEGLELRGGAFYRGGGAMMPSLVGLSPYDARLMLSPPPGEPAGASFADGPVGLVDHQTRHSQAGLASVVAQRPLAGKAIRRHMIVVLTVAP